MLLDSQIISCHDQHPTASYYLPGPRTSDSFLCALHHYMDEPSQHPSEDVGFHVHQPTCAARHDRLQ